MKKTVAISVIAALIVFALVNRTSAGKKALGTNTTVSTGG